MLERIRYLCKQAGTNFSSLEKELGFANGSLAKTDENTKCGRIYAISKRFGVSMEWLMTGQNPADYISTDERAFLEILRKLNADGQAQALLQISMVLNMPEYQKGQKSLGSNVG